MSERDSEHVWGFNLHGFLIQGRFLWDLPVHDAIGGVSVGGHEPEDRPSQAEEDAEDEEAKVKTEQLMPVQ